LLGSCVPPEASVAAVSVIVEHGEEALGPRLSSRRVGVLPSVV
jgi:hypothetical protein